MIRPIRLTLTAISLCLLVGAWVKTVRDSYRMGASDAARPAYAAGLSVGAAEGFNQARPRVGNLQGNAVCPPLAADLITAIRRAA